MATTPLTRMNQMNTTKHNLFAFSNIEETGAVRIGRTGTKYHSASIDPKYGLMIWCGCAGTQQGAAYNKAVFIKGVVGNCKN